MWGSGTLGAGLRRMAVVLAALVVSLTVLPAGASAEDTPPFVNTASFSPTTVPNTGGTVTVTASVVDDIGVSEVHADVSGDINNSVPMTYAGSGNWTGTFDVPPNPTGTPLTFYVQVYATDTNGALADLFAGQGSVAETTPVDEPPQVYDPSVTPAALPYTGGNVSLAVSATDADGGVANAYAVVSTGPGTSQSRVPLAGVGGDRFQGTFAAPANTSNSTLTYYVTLVAADAFGMEDSVEGLTFTVAGRPTGSLEVRPGDRDFGKVKIGRSADRSIVVRNLGGKGTFPVTGVLNTSGAPFSVAGQSAAGLPFTLNPGATKTFTIRFAPTALGLATGRVNVVRSDDKQAGLGVKVTGRGT